ncbi:MAG: aldehyde dehydrogenase family protein [Alphaproteobacteria bacterium]|nr:aldehyde dehydrogenase family protein [Alphaproteobacteria bacterium]
MAEVQKTFSPVDGSLLVERPLATPAQLDAALARAHRAFADWRRTPLDERLRLLTAFTDAFVAKGEPIAEELTRQMGRPIRYSLGEVRGFEERARAMIGLAPATLADIDPGPKAGFHRFIRREPLGVVLVLAPWNYPYLTAVNAIVPALAAGNVVLLKHSDQTPLCAERFTEAALAAGLPEGVFQHIHMSHDLTAGAVADPRVDFVAFTGSVEGGRAVHRAAGGHFKAVGLELGGKDPAYVRADADLAFAVENVVDGAFFNSGQSCCAVERVYVHASLYDDFVARAAALVATYALGNPLDPETTLGPVVRPRNAAAIQAQIDAALAQGARGLVDPKGFPSLGEAYLPPQLLVDVTHDMVIMREETFGPVVGVMPVSGDDEALRLMNDSDYGLTASIWTQDLDAAIALGDRIETGTVFMNRCDYLDPELAWVGVKHSGRGCTLSRVGYEHLTRPKSFHLRTRSA